jgi:hemolysin III
MSAPRIKSAEYIADRVVLGVGIPLSLLGAFVLHSAAEHAGDGTATASVAVYGVTLVAAYLCASLYEAKIGSARTIAVFRAMDRSTIFLLIAGTYTPFCTLALPAVGGWWLLAAEWIIAALGIWLTVFGLARAHAVMPALYLVQGWIGAPWSGALLRHAGVEVFTLVAAGGAAYTLGVGFYLSRWRYGTVIWHLFVVTGSFCHFIAIDWYLLPGLAKG